ncbi:NUDIX hydrolase [Oceanococcus atlanticus]|uniref:NUDIX hydrolase n=1 Tax=Oceanococcus atlanticus TaxID=1317117 RepID=A0A1Y1SAE4_9GAMM|nr:NUDIX hydrolase [Oceanococcus atlanticus]ORE85284.1 NUDIX hydrolase [Oceanococcus atlanticus]RZO84026.1 MAG: NUDIX domain-containing protein [Oceanococcus sp.]
MKYCAECGGTVEHRIPEGDHLPRFICPSCHTIHYQNPRVITGCLPIWQDKVLMCKRAIEPRYGYWTLPAGFLEIGETVAQGAARETMEEARARVEVRQLFSFINVTYIGQIYTLYLAELLDLDFGPGPESLEVELMSEDQIPWDNLAFPTVKLSLQDYFSDRKTGQYRLHTHDLTTPPWRPGKSKG